MPCFRRPRSNNVMPHSLRPPSRSSAAGTPSFRRGHRQKLSTTIPGRHHGAGRNHPVEARPVRSSPAVALDGTVYVGVKAGGTTPGQLIALDPADGSLRWSYGVQGAANDVYSSPTVGADGLVYVGAESQSLYALDATGALVWSFNTNNGINWTSPAIVADGTLYVGNNEGTLFALRTTSLGLASSPWPKFRRKLAGTGR